MTSIRWLEGTFYIVKHGLHVCLVHAVLLVAHPVLGLPEMIEDMFSVHCLVYTRQSHLHFQQKTAYKIVFRWTTFHGDNTPCHIVTRKMHRAVHYLLANFCKTRHYFMLNMCHKIYWEQLEVLKDIFIHRYLFFRDGHLFKGYQDNIWRLS